MGVCGTAIGTNETVDEVQKGGELYLQLAQPEIISAMVRARGMWSRACGVSCRRQMA